MDFTVVGEVVNTSERLCSASKADEILVTEAVLRGCPGALPTIELMPHEPLRLRGKREPLIVHTVRLRP